MLRRLVFNPDHCLACRNCELACAVAHSIGGTLPAAILESPAPRTRVTLESGAEGLLALRCEQCAEPLCVFSCKSGALYRDPESGSVALDESRCVGCWMCVMVCPYGIRPDPARNSAVRCDVCDSRLIPACVEACPTRTLGVTELQAAGESSDFSGRVIVVGSSAAGIAACEAARCSAPGAAITLVTADESPYYSRPLLAYSLAGEIPNQQLEWRTAAQVQDRLNIELLAGLRADSLDAGTRRLRLADGRELAYDRLILATGARAEMPGIGGAGLPGVYALRNIQDLQEIARRAGPGTRAVVLGGGNVGLQTCEALLKLGTHVSVVVRSAQLLSQMVDATAGRLVERLFATHGLVMRTGCDAAEFVGGDQLRGVRLDSGELLDAHLVVVGKGIRPNVEWLKGSGVLVGRGVLVDRTGRTNIPGVFAAGDCAETDDPITGRPAVSGIWPMAYEMGWVAGSTAVGVEKRAAGALRMNSSKFFGVPIISIGEVREEKLPGATSLVLADRLDVYRKLVCRDGRLVGALLYGDISGAGMLYRLYRDGVELDEAVMSKLKDREIARTLGPLVALLAGG